MNRYTNFYKTLNTYLTSGLTVGKATRVLAKDFPELNKVSANIESMPLSAIMNESGAFTRSDVAIVEAGEISGHLDEILLELAHFHEEQDKTKKNVIKGIILPAFHWTAFCFIMPVPGFFTGDMTLSSYLIKVLTPLLIAPAAFFIIYMMIKKTPLLYSVPVIGSIVKYKEKLKFFTSFSLCLKSAISLSESLKIALKTVKHPHLKEKINSTIETFETYQCSFSTAALQAEFLNEEERAFILTGEETGTLPESLAVCAKRNGEKLNEKLSFLGKAIPFFIYMAVIAVIVYSVVSHYKGYVDQLSL